MSDDSGVVGGGGSRRGSDSDSTYSGGGSDTDAGSGVTGDDGSDTSFGGGGDTSTSAPTGSTGSDDPNDSDDGFGGDSDDDDNDVTDRDTTYSGGGSDTTAGSGVTGDSGTDTVFGGGGGEQTTTQTGSGVTGDDSGGANTDPTPTPGDADPDRLDDGDRGFSATRPGTPGSGGILERSERAQADARPDETLTGGLEEQYGAITGAEGRLPSAVQQLQGRIDRETPVDAFSDTDEYDIVRSDGTLGVEFAAGAFGEPRSRREQRQQIARDVASEREGVSAEDVTVTSTAAGFQAVVGGSAPGGAETVITGGPERERVETEIRTGQTSDRGVGITRGPAGAEVVAPEGGLQPIGQPAGSRDVTPFSQAQRDATAGGAPQRDPTREVRNRFGVGIQGDRARVDRPELIEPAEDYTVFEIATGQAGGRRFEQAVINDALGAVGLDDELGFREPTTAQVDADPRGDSLLRYLRGAGPRRQYSVEAQTVGAAIRDRVTSGDVLGAATLGVAAPEPSTTIGGAALLGTALAVGAAQEQQDGPTAAFGELETPEDTQRSELETPTDDGTVTELDIPEDADTVSPTELGVPQEAFEPDENGDLPVDVSGGGEINEDGEIELPAEASGVVVYRNRDEEEEEDDEAEDEDEEETEEEEEIVVDVPEEFVPDDEVTIGGESETTEEEEPVATPPIQGQAEADPEEEEADEEFGRDLFLPRQGQLSDDAEPDDTRADEEDPFGSVDEGLEFEPGALGGFDSAVFGTAPSGPPAPSMLGAVGDDDEQSLTADRSGQDSSDGIATFDMDVQSELQGDAVGAFPRVASDARQRSQSGVRSRAGLQDATAQRTASAVMSDLFQQPIQISAATATTTGITEATMTEPNVTQPEYGYSTGGGGIPPRRLRLPDSDSDTGGGGLFDFSSVGETWETGVVQSLGELDEGGDDPLGGLDDGSSEGGFLGSLGDGDSDGSPWDFDGF